MLEGALGAFDGTPARLDEGAKVAWDNRGRHLVGHRLVLCLGDVLGVGVVYVNNLVAWTTPSLHSGPYTASFTMCPPLNGCL